MDSQKKIKIGPLPLESEFRIASVRARLNELTREELEGFLVDALSIMTALANQTNQLRTRVEELEGKTE